MPWTDPTSEDFDWQAVATVNEYRRAIYERCQVAGLSTVSWNDIPAGQDIQSRAFWSAMQSWAQVSCGYFVKCIDETGNLITDLDGNPEKDPAGNSIMWTIADLWDYVTDGQSTLGPRRYTSHPDDGGTVEYGAMQAGDIIGPWIFEDIQKALNVLIWTRATPTWDINRAGDTYRWSQSSEEGEYFSTRAEAIAKCQGYWTTAPHTEQNQDQQPFAFTQTYWAAGGGYRSVAHTAAGRMAYTTPALAKAVDVHWYLVTHDYWYDQYHNQGIAEAAHLGYNLVQPPVSTTADGSIIRSNECGDPSTIPPYFDSTQSLTYGFGAEGQVILDWRPGLEFKGS